MQLILLSGGSGRRLWPLSNNARSKQFLPFLKREDGQMESMLQRVVRQIREAQPSVEITVTTNTTQQDGVTNQLGNDVAVVAEPDRRRTFPAIALAISHLSLVKHCSDDEVVVVMPCDSYAGADYFQSIGQMVSCVEQNVADLVLMGIKPTYPSNKYGYVMPAEQADATEGYVRVKNFKEKPAVEVAEQLIAQGGLWNGGVFAFRLGYMLQIVRKYVPVGRVGGVTDYEAVRQHFCDFPEIAFDYEVVEKAQSMAAVPFYGEWKDLGTWRTLTEEIHTPAIGNVVMGANCQNTHVINELQNPIYVGGLKDVVVAACPDGILVCSKEHSAEIKHDVEHLTPRPMYEERRWGTYRVLDDTRYADGNHSLTKSITLLPGRNISYQVHHHRSEIWTFVEGEGIFVLDGERRHVKAGDSVVIPVQHFHAIRALTKLTFIEVQIGNPLVEEDIERFDFQW